MSRTKFQYIGDKKNTPIKVDPAMKESPVIFHSGVITVASIADFQTGKVRIGLSFCSPDDRFLRWKGRLIAEGRMKKNPIILGFKTKPADAVCKFLYGLVNNNPNFCDHVESLPKKAEKHFPTHFPWFQEYELPFGILRVIEGATGGQVKVG